jgi:cation diffusion facilitator family transporter
MFEPTPIRLAIGSILVGFGVLALKFWAAQITGSVAILSDALESIVNVVAAFAALIAVRLAARPADATLPYGYHKAEYFSAVLEGVFILIAAFAIFYQAAQAIIDPHPVALSPEGLGVILAATVINGVWCMILIRQGRKLRSPAIEADGQHLWTDVLSSLGVIAGLLLAVLTGWLILDALIAILVGINILWSGSRLVARSVGGLMDVAVPADELDRIRQTIQTSAEGAIEAHDVRTRRAGPMTFIEFHLVVPGGMSVDAAHEICDRIEAELKAVTEGAHVTIHVEPDHKAKHSGVAVL